MESASTLSISQTAAISPAAASRGMILRPVSTNIVQTYFTAIVGQQQSNLPAFTTEPNRVDVVYTATNGTAYFLPQIVVAQRKDNPNAPDVFIDHNGAIYTLMATFNLMRHSALPATAIPLPVDNFTVTLQSSSQGVAVPLTRVQVLPLDGANGLLHQILAQQDVDLNTILAILQSDANAWFNVQADVSYRLQAPAPGPTQPPVLIVNRPIYRFPVEGQPARISPLASSVVGHALEMNLRETPTANLSNLRLMVNPGLPWRPPPPPPADLRKTNVPLFAVDKSGVKACYPSANPANRSIYAKVDPAFGDNPDAAWSVTPFGYVKQSGIPNQYYILPDKYGLAFEPAQGLPDMSLIVRKEAGATGGPAVYHFRVRFAIAPWLDAARLDNLRRYFRQECGIAYADLVIGGYETATFKASHLFDSLGSMVVDGAQAGAPATTAPPASGTGNPPAANNQQVDAAAGFELVLDCTQEFYALMTPILTKAPGLEGSVSITLKTQDQPAFKLDFPAQLRLDSTATHPLTTRLPASAPAPDPTSTAAPAKGPLSFTVSNPSQVDVTVDKLLTTLLLQDEHMPYPCLAAPVAAQIPQSAPLLDLPPNTKDLAVSLTPSDTLAAWSAIAVDFAGVNVKFDPAKVLDRIHQLAVSTDLNTTVRVWSYLLQHPDQIPASLTGLIGIHVQVRRGTATPLDVRLTIGNADQTLQIAFTVVDLLSGMSPNAPTIEYRCANIFAANESAWSPWQTNAGSDLMVFPTGV